MKRLTTYRLSCIPLPSLSLNLNQSLILSLILILNSLVCPSLHAQDTQQQQLYGKAPLLNGIAVSADLVGFAMKAVGAKFANMEVGARLNLYDKYFPIAELGIGDCKREGAETGNFFSATAPYMRFGIDYNFNKKHNGNRLFGILRYGFSSFKYDIGNNLFTDPVYGTTIPLQLNGQKATAQWLEFGLGLETKLWSFVRLGWSMRYKFMINIKCPYEGSPYFVPGFGKNDDNGWGGTVNLVFDVGQNIIKAKNKKKEQKKTKQ